MRSRTRVRPVLRPVAQRRTDWIEQHVADGGPKMALVHGEGRETSLPEATLPSFSAVDHRRIALVRDGQRAAKAAGICRNGDEMEVIGEEAVRPDRDLLLLAVLGQEIAVIPIVERSKEGRLAPIPPLSHVVGQARHDEASDSCHTQERRILECESGNTRAGCASARRWGSMRLLGPSSAQISILCPLPVSRLCVPFGSPFGCTCRGSG